MTLYVSDLDGTLLRPDATIADKAAEKLNALTEKGVLFTYATARSFSSAAPLVSKLNLTCPAVTFNGVFVVDPKDGRHLAENIPDEKSLSIVKSFIEENNFAPLVYSYIDSRERVSYLEDRLDAVREYVESRKGDKRLRAVKSYNELFDGDVFYLTLFNLDEKQEKQADAVFCRENGFSHNSQRDTYNDSVWYEIYSDCAGKAAAVIKAAQLVGADRLVCFGDNKNDIPMLLCADKGLAVENACEELIAAADEVIKPNTLDGVVEYIWQQEKGLHSAEITPAKKTAKTAAMLDEYSRERFSAALSGAMSRTRGNHGSVGTQNEKLIHAALKNYYVPAESSQEIRIGRFIADAVSEDGIFEIQSRSLHLLREKLQDFTAASFVTIVHPISVLGRSVFINEDAGEIITETEFRRAPYLGRLFEELYSLRGWLDCEQVGIIIACLKTEKRIYHHGNNPPNMRSRTQRKRVRTEKIPLELTEEIRLFSPQDYLRFLPKGLGEKFTKIEFCKAAKESRNSLRLEVLRSVGVIEHIENRGKQYVYTLSEKFKGDVE